MNLCYCIGKQVRLWQVAAKRVEAGKALLAAYPEIEWLIADDGLQHYALARDIEIAVFPYADVGRRI